MVMLANDGIIILQDDRIVMANPAFLEMLGFDFVDLEGKPITGLLEPTTAHQFEEVQEGFNWGQSGRPAFRARFLKKDGSLIEFDDRAEFEKGCC